MIDAAVFIGLAIIAVTQVIKELVPRVAGALTVCVAVALGVLVALIDTSIGIANISVASGIIIALGAVGFHTAVAH